MCKKSVNFLDINIATTRELPITQNVKKWLRGVSVLLRVKKN